MTTPHEPHQPDQPISFDDLVDFILGVLTSDDEKRLLERIGNDPGAGDKLAKLRAVDTRVASAFGRRAPRSRDEASDPEEARAATLETYIAEQDRRRRASHDHRQSQNEHAVADSDNRAQ